MPQPHHPISTITALDHGPLVLEGTGQAKPWTIFLHFLSPKNSYKVWHHWKKTDDLLHELPFYGEHDIEVSSQSRKQVQERRVSALGGVLQVQHAEQEEANVVWGVTEGRWLFNFER